MTDADLRVMIVDDHEVVREGLRSLLNRRAGMTVVAEAGSVAEAVELALKEKPQVVVMDVRLPDGSGVEACREIRSHLPDTRMIMLTSYADDEAVIASIIAALPLICSSRREGSNWQMLCWLWRQASRSWTRRLRAVSWSRCGTWRRAVPTSLRN
jgi:DNA-binding NarL/FixJ family response regulator